MGDRPPRKSADPGGPSARTLARVSDVDFETFRLRRFVERLVDLGEVEIHEKPVRLIDLSCLIEATDKATLFKKVGPEEHELVAAVSGSRRRVAAAFGVDVRDTTQEYLRRLETPQPIREVSEAPVHEVVKTGDQIDLTRLPFFLQHQLDGGPYISAAIDYSVDPFIGRRNVGCRRLMLRDERTLTSNLTQPSDLKDIYRRCVEAGRPLQANFVIGSHPLDFLAATLRVPCQDELGLVAAMRGKPLPVVRGVTTDLMVPADAELVIEGYFDSEGWRVLDGPYGEWWGFYGPTHPDPLFHVTALTMRRDVLHQTVLHGTRHLERCDSSGAANVSAEANAWRVLEAAGLHPTAVCHVGASPHGSQLRVALKRDGQNPGQARAAIAALFMIPMVKHVTVVDDDIDVFSDAEVSWAQTTRLRPDRDVVIESGFPGRVGLDHTVDAAGTISKIGFDATVPAGSPEDIEHWRPLPPRVEHREPRCASVREALAAGPKFFVQVMQALGSSDGREIAVELERLRCAGLVDRLPNGEWRLA
jgi:2,5-furandicarboxylate decarboxylase 1